MILLNSISRLQFTRVLGLILVAGIVLCFIITEPIAQQNDYHGFSNDHVKFQLENFWNVISNLPFIFLGIGGLIWWSKLIRFFKKNNLDLTKRWLCLEPLFFIGILAIGLGSTYYHINPTLSTLFWDRLPMALVFSTLFVIIIRDFVSYELSSKLKTPIIVSSLLSVVYWIVSEHFGRGDLRPYVLVQFLPMLCIPYFLWLNNYRKKTKLTWFAVGFYFLAKLAEYFDYQIFELTSFIAGHPIKHFLAAVAMVYVIKHIKKQVQ